MFRQSMATRVKIGIACALLVGLPLGVSSAASAASSGVGPAVQPDPDPSELARGLAQSAPIHAKKEALFALHRAAMASGDWRAFDAAINKLNTELSKGRSAPVHHSASPDSLYSAKQIPLWQQAQQAKNWCGPATGAAMVQSWGWTQFPVWMPDQDTMHAWMLTGPAGSDIGTSIDWFTNGLNTALGDTYYGFTSNLAGQGPTWFRDAVTQNIDANWSASADTTEPANGAHYNAHPTSLTIAHYIAVYRYDNYGDSLSFADPASGGVGLGWSGVAQYFADDTTTFFYNYMNLWYSGRGLIW